MNNILIDYAKEYCYENSPSLLFNYNLITVNVEINNIKLIAMIDTGCSNSVLTDKVIEKCKLEDIVDLLEIQNINTANGHGKTIGRIWYLELLMNNYSVPISPNIIKNDVSKFDIILGIDFLSSNNIDINFSKKELNISNNIKIKFDI